MHNPFLIGPRLYLRPPEVEDAPTLCAWLNHPEVRRTLARSTPLSRCAEEQLLRGLDPSHDLILVIVLQDGDRPIGLVGLHSTKSPRARELGVLIGDPTCWDHGYGREAIGLLLDHAFGDLDLHRIQLLVHEENARAVTCYERLGFVREGVLRDAHFRDGRFGNDLVMSVLAPEWRARRVT